MTAPVEAAAIDVAVQRFIHFLETGQADPALFVDEVFCDFSLPTWRLQARGRADTTALRQQGHPAPGRVVRHRVRPTDDGFVLELEERWHSDGDDWYCRECFCATLAGDAIAELSVYCTGDWSGARQQQHGQRVTLLRP
jgi:hypothetical protein